VELSDVSILYRHFHSFVVAECITVQFSQHNYLFATKGISVFAVHHTFQTKLSSSGEYHTIYERNLNSSLLLWKRSLPCRNVLLLRLPMLYSAHCYPMQIVCPDSVRQGRLLKGYNWDASNRTDLAMQF